MLYCTMQIGDGPLHATLETLQTLDQAKMDEMLDYLFYVTQSRGHGTKVEAWHGMKVEAWHEGRGM